MLVVFHAPFRHFAIQPLRPEMDSIRTVGELGGCTIPSPVLHSKAAADARGHLDSYELLH